MIVYAESSAVLAWLFGEAAGKTIRERLMSADRVIASELTLLECERVLHRATALGHIEEGEAARRSARLLEAAAHWDRVALAEEVLERARRAFPVEPLRTLDALHLATALVVSRFVSDLEILTLDRRVRANGRALGLPVAPESA